MLNNPILRWELIRGARQGNPFRRRVVYAAILSLVFWGTHAEVHSSPWTAHALNPMAHQNAVFAHHFFVSFTFIQLVAVALVTPAILATAIVREREQKTIEYLFASELSNSEILIGKLIARLGSLILLILVGLPILSLSLVFGGIDVQRLLIMTLATLATLVSTASVSLATSVGAASSKSATNRAHWSTFLLFLLPFLFWAVQANTFNLFAEWNWPIAHSTWSSSISALAELLLATNPFALWYSLIGSTNPFDWSVLAPLAIGHASVTALALTFSMRRLRTIHSKRAGEAKIANQRVPYRLPGPSLERHPMAWKDWRVVRGKYHTIGLIGALLLVTMGWLWIYFRWAGVLSVGDRIAASHVRLEYCIVSELAFAAAMISVLSLSSNSVGVERDRDCWSGLLVTPLSAREIVVGKMIGAMRPVALAILFLSPIIAVTWWLGGISLIAIPFHLGCYILFGLIAAALGVYMSLIIESGKAARTTFTIAFLLQLFVRPGKVVSSSVIPPRDVASFAHHFKWLDLWDHFFIFVFLPAFYMTMGLLLTWLACRRIPDTGRLEPVHRGIAGWTRLLFKGGAGGRHQSLATMKTPER